MIELEVYAAGIRNGNKVLELGHELETIPGLRYKLDQGHDILFMEAEEPNFSLQEIRGVFERLGFAPRFVGAIPPELL